ncbi:MAG: dihydrodipicolinate synthase family protein, partial [Planctomycetota bacterium]
TRRKITGMSAILLPMIDEEQVDWQGLRNHISRTLAAGLVPAVNMDTGFANLIDEATRIRVLQQAKELCAGRQFVAGAFVSDHEGSSWDADAYAAQIESIQNHGGTPIVFQSFGLTEGTDENILDRYRQIATYSDRFLAFELGQMFAPFGRIYSLALYEQLIQIPHCIGAKHSSLSRELEWQRLAIRDAVRGDFMVLTGNDLAIDMVQYGSDYLLGLSTCAPDVFALRDAMWESGDAAFYEVNDWLQYLGFLIFRPPVPAYKHSAAQFLKLRGWIDNDVTYPGSPTRPNSDRAILREILASACFETGAQT